MGPGIMGANMGTWSLLGRSSGQGESYIFDLAVDLYWLRFLKISNQLDSDRLVTSLHSLNKGILIYGKKIICLDMMNTYAYKYMLYMF